MPLFAHVSDPHLDGGPEALARARRVVDHLAGLRTPPDAVLVSGDISDRGHPDDYSTAATLFATTGVPVVYCPGNHDDRAAFRTALLGEAPSTEPVLRSATIAGLTVLSVDSSVPGRPEGHLTPEALAWLDTRLAGCGPALVMLHHPPAPLGIPALDRIGLRDPVPLAELIARHPHVRAVLAGHAHTAASTTFAGRPLLVAPGVRSTARPPWEVGEHYAMSTDAPPALTFHIITGDTVTSHVRSV